MATRPPPPEPAVAEAQHLLAARRGAEATGMLVAALADGRGGLGAARLLARLLGTYRLEPSSAVEAAVRAACRFEELDLQPLVRTAIDCLFAQPSWKPLAGAAAADLRDGIETLLRSGDPSLFDDPLLHAVLARGICPDIELERILVALRAALVALPRTAAGGWLGVAVALGRQAANNEYAWPTTPEEEAAVGALVDGIDAGAPSEIDVARAAMYGPPASLPKFAEWQAQVTDDALRALFAATAPPSPEPELRRAIRVVASPRDPVSRRMQAQYEENPYPRWLALNPPAAGERRGRLFARCAPAERSRFAGPIEVLIAGCGTGRQAIAAALGYGEPVRVTAIDLSMASLAYAAGMARHYGVMAIEFLHADLLDAERLGHRFDVIEAIGVLHHLADPVAGWRALAQQLEPGGLMNVAVYSERGRQDVVAARRAIATLGLRPTPDGIRRLRRLVLEAPPEAKDWRATVRRFTDFFTLSGCRDLLFNAQEHRFTPLALRGILDELGLQLLAVDAPAAALARYRRQFPEDAEARDLALWDRYEADHPTTFSGMIGLWCRRRP